MFCIKYLAVHSCPASFSPTTFQNESSGMWCQVIWWVGMEILQEPAASIFSVMMEIASSSESLLSTGRANVTAQKTHIFVTCYCSLHNWPFNSSEGCFEATLVVHAGLTGCLEIHFVFHETGCAHTIRTLAVFCTEGTHCTGHSDPILLVCVSMGTMFSHNVTRMVSFSIIYLLDLQVVWCNRLFLNLSLYFVKCHPLCSARSTYWLDLITSHPVLM
jgi:hypothetical protein